MLHASEWEAGQQHLVIFGERESAPEIAREVPQAGAAQVANRRPLVLRPEELGPPNEKPEGATVNDRFKSGKGSDGEGEEVGADGRCWLEMVAEAARFDGRIPARFTVGDHCHLRRHRETQPEPALQIGLVKAGKGKTCVHWYG